MGLSQTASLQCKLAKLMGLSGGRVPKELCDHYGLEDKTAESFLAVHMTKGRRGRGKMEHRVDLALRKAQTPPEPEHPVRPPYTWGGNW